MKLIISLLILFSLSCNSTKKKEEAVFPKTCQTSCKSPFGEVLGASPSGVKSYSNCSSDCVYMKAAFAIKDDKKVYTGIEWQCVEYARRSLLKDKGVVFPSVDYAFEIWSSTPNFKTPEGKNVLWKNFFNGNTRKPLVGDLLIYGKDFLGTGHVAVVTKINKSYIYVAEQNYSNLKWEGEDYSRKISYIVKDKKYWILDTHLLGWKSDKY